jgi:hypothetical protein
MVVAGPAQRRAEGINDAPREPATTNPRTTRRKELNMEHSTLSDPPNHAAEVFTFATCKRCGDDKLSWKKSSKTGKWYLCDVQCCLGSRFTDPETKRSRYFQLARLPHKCPGAREQ